MASDDTVSNSAKDSVASNDTAGGSKKAIVVEGGAMRGIFASGVIDHCLERGLGPDATAYPVDGGWTPATSDQRRRAQTRGRAVPRRGLPLRYGHGVPGLDA